jgi:Na+-driven multidrug efflux pump
MTTTVGNNKRIAKNTLLLYVRMLLLMTITLYTSRVVLSILGVTDFGIFNVVGGIVSMFGFLNNSMSISVQRFLSFEIGCGNKHELNRIFNASLLAHIIIAILILIVAETLGLWFVKTQLNIPIDRFDAAIWVYHSVVISCAFTITQVPYNAIILSKEKMAVYAYISIVEVLLKLVIVYLLLFGNFDKLELYGVLTTCVTIIIALLYRAYAMHNFPEVKVRLVWDVPILKRITGFAGWSMFGEIAWIFAEQGVNILLNVFFCPIVNAARAISEQIYAAVSRFVSSFQVAVNPQLIKQYATGELVEMKILLFRSTRFSFFLLLLFSIPLLLEMDYILKLWLSTVPEHASLFCRLVLISALFNSLSNLLATVARAYGKIRKYQIIVSSVIMLNFPISYLILKMGGIPESTMLVYMCISALLLIIRLYLVKPMIELSIRKFIQDVLFPITKVCVTASIIPILFYFMMEQSFLKLCLSTIISIASVGVSVYFVGMNTQEQNQVKKILLKTIAHLN